MFTRAYLRSGLLVVACAALIVSLGGCPRPAPTVISTDPADGETGVPLNSNIAAIFSESMDPETVNADTFTLRQGTTPVSGAVTYSGVTAVFNPTASLAPNTEYTATITTGAKTLVKKNDSDQDQSENSPGEERPKLLLLLLILGSVDRFHGDRALAEDVVWTFTTGAAPDTTAPTVSSTVPSNGAAGAPLGRDLAAVFSESMNPTTIDTTSFTLMQGTTSIPGAVNYSGVTATFNPVGDLAPNTTYTAAITTEAEDLAGNPMLSDHVWTFTTGATLDTTAPAVSSTDPENEATGVALNKTIAAVFSESMNPTTIDTTSFTLMQGTTSISGAVNYSGVTATFNPVGDLAPNTTYTATITTEAEDLAGNPMLSDHVWTFTTGATLDTTAPAVSSTDPENEATGVALNKSIAAVFSESMNPATMTTMSFTLIQGTMLVPGAVNYAGVTATFDPLDDLAPNTTYTATITTEAEDLAGNMLVSDFEWTFTTGAASDSTAPTVSSTDPANGANGVPLNKKLAVTFSEIMDPLTINTTTVLLRQGTTPVLGAVAYSGVTATLTPFTDLLPNTTYTATVLLEATDLAGNALVSDFEWTFTTGAASDSTAPTVSSTDPANGAIGVPLNKNLAITFSEIMDSLTIDSTTVLLRQGSTPVLGAVAYSGVTATFNPFDDLAPNTTYTASVTTGAEDLAGNMLVSDFEWTFTTGATPDTTAPSVSSTDPENEATEVALNKTIAAVFSESMNSTTIDTTSFTLMQGTMSISGAVNYAGVTATFNPIGDLAPDTTYTATITTEAEDQAGNPTLSDHVWTFSTGAIPDTTAPTVISSDPDNGAIDVPINQKVAATFSEAMDPLTVDTTTFLLRQGTTSVLGTVEYAGVTATFTPIEDLALNTTYTATVLFEATDLAGNELVSDFEWSFTTGTAVDPGPPEVILTDPVDGAIGVPINKKISATFSEAMDPLTVNTNTFILINDTAPATLIGGAVFYEDVTATFTPFADLVANSSYTATVLLEVTDLAGNQMVSDQFWSFTTGVTTAQEPIDLVSANSFAILAGSTVTNTGESIVTGDLGVSPGTAIAGFPPGVLNGQVFTGVDSAAGQAKEDLTNAFNEAAGRSTGAIALPGDLSGLTLFPGLYTNSTSVMLASGAVTLDAQGDPNAVFLFQMGSTLTTGSGTEVILAGGANSANIYWQVGSSATLGTNSTFKGNILAQESITLTTGATLDGRALTQTAAVSLDAAFVTAPAP